MWGRMIFSRSNWCLVVTKYYIEVDDLRIRISASSAFTDHVPLRKFDAACVGVSIKPTRVYAQKPFWQRL